MPEQNMTGGEVDLHGLYVKEAIHYAARGIECGLERGDREVRFIVGRLFPFARRCVFP